MNYSIKNILVPIDFSETSLNAVNTAIRMGKRHGATLHLLHVISPKYFYPTAGIQAPVFTLSEEILRSNIDNLNNYCASIKRNHKVNCISHSQVGAIVSATCKTAESENCDIIVIGTNTNSNALGYLSGNVAYSVLKESKCPVLTVPASKRINMFKKVVFPVRPVANAISKYDFSKEILNKNDSTVHIIGALQTEDTAKYADIRRLVHNVEGTLEKEMLDHSSEYHFSKNIAKNLLATCSKLSADLIIITASTQRSLKQYFSGNYTQKIINNDEAAVLCIKL